MRERAITRERNSDNEGEREEKRVRVYVCVCVCVREKREREIAREGKKERNGIPKIQKKSTQNNSN